MLIIPAIDLKDGRCVRLKQGDMLAVPMCLLYEAGLFFARFVVVRRAEQTAEPAETQ